MGRHDSTRPQLQVLYLGNSAALGMLRRTMEAHGVVTRARLTPGVDAVVADPTVPSDHPTVRTAASLGIPVLDPASFQRLVGLSSRSGSLPPAPTRRSRFGWSTR